MLRVSVGRQTLPCCQKPSLRFNPSPKVAAPRRRHICGQSAYCQAALHSAVFAAASRYAMLHGLVIYYGLWELQMRRLHQQCMLQELKHPWLPTLSSSSFHSRSRSMATANVQRPASSDQASNVLLGKCPCLRHRTAFRWLADSSLQR